LKWQEEREEKGGKEEGRPFLALDGA